MNLRRTFSLIALVAILLGLVPAMALAQDAGTVAPVQPQAGKIDPQLLDLFAVKGSGDFIALFAEQADLSPAYKMGWTERGEFVYNALKDTAERSQAAAKELLDKQGLAYRTFIAGNELYVFAGSQAAAELLAGLPEVAYVRATRTYQIDPPLAGSAPANAPQATTDWGITDSKADQFWAQYGYEGDGMVVANIDTGVDYTHAALNGNYKCQANPSNPECWLDPSTVSCTGPNGGPCDTIYSGIYHGSHTMGTMVAENDPGLTWIAGMAPNAKWIACLGCPSGSCPDLDLNTCADWIVAPNGNPAARPNVVNNSWGGSGGNTWYLGKVNAWRAAGVFPAFSAGNNYSCTSLGSPGDYQESFGSAAHSSDRAIADFSSKGPSTFGHDPYTKPNISAPGEDIWSTQPNNGWVAISGTSMASPHSAGAVALLWSCNPSLVGQIDQTFQILQSMADVPPAGSCGAPPDGQGNYTFGYGYLDMLTIGAQYCVTGWGAINGHVYDAETSAPIDGVSVTGYRDAGGSWSDDTDPTGYYSMTVGAGTYTVEAVHPLYATGSVSGLDVVTDTVVTQNFYLQPRGHLYGYVTDQDSGAPLAGTVSVAGGPSTATDPATGYYEFYLDAGTYDVTASAPDYADETASVTLGIGSQVQHDFSLLAAIAVVPDPIQITLEMGQTGSVVSQMTNNMAVPYPFQFKEKESQAGALAGEDILVVRKDTTAAAAMEAALTALDVSFLGVTDAQFQAMTVPDLLGYQAVFYAGMTGTSGTPTASEILLMAYLDAGGQLYISDNDLGYYRHGNAFYDTYLQSTYVADSGGELLTGEDVMAGLNPDVTTDPYPDSFTVGAEGTRIFKWSTADNAGGVLVERGGYQAFYTSFDFQQIASTADETELINRIVGMFVTSDVPWFGTSITGGTVPANTTINWTNAFSATTAAGIGQPGEYNAVLRILPVNAPTLPKKEIAVHMTVLPSTAFGQITGIVTSDRPGGPLEANVLIEATDGTTVALTTDPATGFYSYWLEEGTYDVTASADGYLPQTASVPIVGQQVTTQDFELVLNEPEIIVAPPSLAQTLVFGQTAVQVLTITNDGVAELTYELIEAPAVQAVNGGGPDPFGYTWKDSNEAGGATYDWIDATDGTALGLADDGEANVTLPFPFDFYGTSSTALRVGNNGGFIFNATTGDLSNVNADLASTTASNIVVPFWDDVDADTGDVYVKTIGSAPHRTFVVEWYNRPHFSNVGSATFELVLYEGTNNIKFQYQDVDFGNASYDWGISATAGIRQTGTNFLQYSYNQAVLQNEMAICFNYPGEPPCDGGDVLWLSEQPTGGTVQPGESTDVDVTFDSSMVVEPGTYHATLSARSNDPLNGRVDVPVTMNVLPSGTIGKLDGTVTSDRPGGPLEADLLIESSGGLTWTLTSDPDTGYYYKWLEAGTYNVTASADGYLPQTVPVQVTALQTTTQDFQLALEAAEIGVEPPLLYQSLDLGDTAVQNLTISNAGLAPLTYEVRERPVNTVLANTILLMGDDLDSAEWDIYRATLAAAGYSWDEWDLLTLPFPTPAELAPYETLIWTDDGTLDPADAECQVVADWLISGDKSLLGIGIDFIWDLANGTPGAGEHNLYLLLNTTYLGDYAGTGIATLDGVAGDPIGGDFVAPNGLALAMSTGSNGDYADIASVATTAAIYAAGGTGSGSAGLTHYEDATYKTVWLGINFHNGLTDPAQRELLMANMMGFLAGGDVPWLSEAPITGTVQPGESVDVAVTFNAGQVPAPGTYQAELRVVSNDPYNSPVDVPVTLAVQPTADLGKLEGTVTGEGYCDADSYPLEATVVIEAPDGSSWTVGSDPTTGYYFQWLNAGTYTVTASAPEHVDAAAVVEITGMVTTTQDLAVRLVESCLDVTPTSFSLTLPVDTQLTEPLTIDNAGAGELLWELHETTRTVAVNAPAPSQPSATPAGPTGQPVITSPEQCAQYANYAGLEPIGAEKFCGSPAQAVVPSSAPLSPTDIGYALDIGYISDNFVMFELGDFTGQTVIGTNAVPFYGMDFDPSATVLYALNDTTDELGTIDLATGAFTGLVPCPPPVDIWTGLTIDPTTGVFYASDATTLYTLNPATGNRTLVGPFGTTLMIDIAINMDGQMYGHDIGTDSIYQIDPATGQATIIGSTGYSANYAQGMDFDNDDGTLYIFLYQGSGANVYGTVNLATGAVTPLSVSAPQGEFEGATQTAGIEPWTDVPWVTEVPTSGVVPPDTAFDVDVTFDTTGLTVGECYTASLGLVHDDPGQNTPFYIPLTLCVEEEQCDEITDADLSVLTPAPIFPGDVVTFQADLLPDDATAPFSYAVNGGATQTANAEPFTFELTFDAPGTYPVELAVWNCDMAEPIVVTVEVVVEEPCEEVTDVALTVLTAEPIYIGDVVTFEANVSPDDATAPYSYAVNGGATQTADGEPFTFTLSFGQAGTQTVTIAVWNCDMAEPVVATVDVLIHEPEAPHHFYYLPIVHKYYPPAR